MPITKTTVTHSLIDPSASTVQRSGVIRLGGFVGGVWRDIQGMTADGQIITWVTANADSSGAWSVALIPNADVVSPANTLYRYMPAQGQAVVFEVGSTASALKDLVVSDPAQWPGLAPTVKGDAATVDVDPVAVTGAAGSAVAVANTGTTSAARFQFTIPRGDPGAAATVAVDPSSGGVPHGTPTSIVNTGTVNAAVIRFLIEQAQDGTPGSQILTGTGTPTGTPPDGTLFLDTGNGNVWRYSGGAWSGSPVLNIMGPAGSPTAFELRGTGFPEGVVTASPGTYYTDTAGTNGAWRWLKTSGSGNTGWVVSVGDTGWRYLDSTYFPNFANTDGGIRRINNRIHLLLSVKVIHYNTDILSVPTGFLGAPSLNVAGSAKLSTQVMLNNEISDSSFVFAFDGSVVKFHGKNVGTDGAATTQFARISWAARNSEPWPANLPGVPVIPS